MIYRYVLETIEQPVATLGKELELCDHTFFFNKFGMAKI